MPRSVSRRPPIWSIIQFYLWFLRKLADGFEASWPTLGAAMEQIRSLLVTRAGMLCNVTIDAARWHRFKPELTSFLAALPSSSVANSSWQIGEGPSAEALNYSGKRGLKQGCRPLTRLGFKPSGADHVVVKYSARLGCGIRSAFRAARMAASARLIIGRAISPTCLTVTPTYLIRLTSTTRRRVF